MGPRHVGKMLRGGRGYVLTRFSLGGLGLRLAVTAIIFAMVALFPSWISAQMERPSWVDTNAANYPAQVEAVVFSNGTFWDGDHSSIVVGRWQFTRSGPLTERLSGTQLGSGVPYVSSPNRSACFYAIIMPFNCYNSAVPTHTSCAMALSWSPNDGAICEIFAGPPPLPNHFPERDISFRIACPKEIRYVITE